MSATTTTTNGEKKTTEFARLFDFFSRLASGDRDLYVPKEFESLVDVLPVSPTSSMASLPGLCRSPDSVTTSISLPSVDDEDEHEEHETTQNNLKPVEFEELKDVMPVAVPRGRKVSIAVVRGRNIGRARRFPLAEGSNQQFTFKMMIHELYDINGFANMVQEVLAASQRQFQPLPESLKGNPKKRQSIGEDSFTGVGRRDEVGECVKGGRFPKGLGLGRPSGLDIPAAERALKKRRVGRRRSVSGGPMEKEPEWIEATALPSIDVTIDEICPLKAPSPTAIRPSTRTRKYSASASRARTASVAQKRTPVISSIAKEAPVVKYAETFLSVPKQRLYGSIGGRRSIGRARSEEPESGEMPMSAPCTRDSFGVLPKGETVEAKTNRSKRRLSFST